MCLEVGVSAGLLQDLAPRIAAETRPTTAAAAMEFDHPERCISGPRRRRRVQSQALRSASRFACQAVSSDNPILRAAVQDTDDGFAFAATFLAPFVSVHEEAAAADSSTGPRGRERYLASRDESRYRAAHCVRERGGRALLPRAACAVRTRGLDRSPRVLPDDHALPLARPQSRRRAVDGDARGAERIRALFQPRAAEDRVGTQSALGSRRRQDL